jgi:hypothetical protein
LCCFAVTSDINNEEDGKLLQNLWNRLHDVIPQFKYYSIADTHGEKAIINVSGQILYASREKDFARAVYERRIMYIARIKPRIPAMI